VIVNRLPSRGALAGFRDYEWIASLITAVGQITVTAIKAGTQGGVPQCPAGYTYHPEVGGCIPTQAYNQSQGYQQQNYGPGAGTEWIPGVPNAAVAIGGGVLLLLLLKK